MNKSNLALRLQPSLMDQARKVAKAEGIAVNQLINVAIAEKLSVLRAEEYFAERAARGNVTKALRILKRAGAGNAPVPGDGLPVSSARRTRSSVGGSPAPGADGGGANACCPYAFTTRRGETSQ